MYLITAQVETKDGDYTGSRQVPQFYIDGITDERTAIAKAIDIIDPGGFAQRSGQLTRLHITAVKIER